MGPNFEQDATWIRQRDSSRPCITSRAGLRPRPTSCARCMRGRRSCWVGGEAGDEAVHPMRIIRTPWATAMATSGRTGAQSTTANRTCRAVTFGTGSTRASAHRCRLARHRAHGKPEVAAGRPKLGTFFAYGGTFGPPDPSISDGQFLRQRPHRRRSHAASRPGRGEEGLSTDPDEGRRSRERRGRAAKLVRFPPGRGVARGDWRVVAEGKILQQGRVADLKLAPREKKIVALPIKAIAPCRAPSISSNSVSS